MATSEQCMLKLTIRWSLMAKIAMKLALIFARLGWIKPTLYFGNYALYSMKYRTMGKKNKWHKFNHNCRLVYNA